MTKVKAGSMRWYRRWVMRAVLWLSQTGTDWFLRVNGWRPVRESDGLRYVKTEGAVTRKCLMANALWHELRND